MKRLLFILSLLIGVTSTVTGQAVVGGSGVCVTNADPNTVTDLANQDPRYGCLIAYDSVTKLPYWFDGSKLAGFKWRLIDYSIVNELQSLSISNDTISLSSDGYVVLPATNFSKYYTSSGTDISNDSTTAWFGQGKVLALYARLTTGASSNLVINMNTPSDADLGKLFVITADDEDATYGVQIAGLNRINGADSATYTMVHGESVVMQAQLTDAGNRWVAVSVNHAKIASIVSSSATKGTGTAGKLALWAASDSLKNSIVSDDGTRVSLDDASTSTAKPFRLDSWATANRPAVPSAGDAGWNTTNTNLDIHSGTAWENPVKSATSSGLGTALRGSYFDANGRLATATKIGYEAATGEIGFDIGYAGSATGPTLRLGRGSVTSGGLRLRTAQSTSPSTQEALIFWGGSGRTSGFWEDGTIAFGTGNSDNPSNFSGYIGSTASFLAGSPKNSFLGSASGATGNRNTFYSALGSLGNITSGAYELKNMYLLSGGTGISGTFSGFAVNLDQLMANNDPQKGTWYGIRSRLDHLPTAGDSRSYNIYVGGTINHRGANTSISSGVTIDPTITSVASGRYRGLELTQNSQTAIYQSGTSAINNLAGNTRVGSTSTPARTLDVTGEARVSDLTTDTPTRIVGADGDGDLAQILVGSEIGIGTGDTLKILQQGATSGQALAWNGSNWRPTTISTSNIYSADGTLTGNRTLTGGAYTLTLTRDSSLVELGTTYAKLGYKDPANPFNLANITASREQVNVLVSNSGVSNTTQFTIQEDSVFFVGVEESAAYNYALPHKSPSVTSGAKSLMEWTGNGTGSGVNFTTSISSSYLTDVIKLSEDSFNMGDDNQLTLVSSTQAAGAPTDNAFGMLVPFQGISANVNWQVAGLATGSDALRMWMRAEGILGATNWRRIALWKDGEDAGSVDVSASGDNVTLTLDTASVTGTAYGPRYTLKINDADYNATTVLASYSDMYIWAKVGTTANRTITLPTPSATYEGKVIHAFFQDANTGDSYFWYINAGTNMIYQNDGSGGTESTAYDGGGNIKFVHLICMQKPDSSDYRWVVMDRR